MCRGRGSIGLGDGGGDGLMLWMGDVAIVGELLLGLGRILVLGAGRVLGLLLRIGIEKGSGLHAHGRPGRGSIDGGRDAFWVVDVRERL